jgi:FPC/CPF motif-containing protein YcgG
MSEKLLAKTDTNLNKILNGKKLEDYQQDYAKSYLAAYGDKNSNELAKAYSNDQENAVQKAKMGVQVGG